MARRIDVELTSSREDGTWTWRAAGAKQPKGDISAGLMYEGASVGDICRVEAEFLVDGIEVVEVMPPKAKKERSDLLEMISRPLADSELVTEVRAPRGGGGGRRDGRGRRDGGKGRGRDGGRGRGDGDKRRGRREGGDNRNRGPRPDPIPERPKPKRLRPRRVHREAALASVPDEHRPIADQVLQGGLPAVRSAIEKQNAEAKAEGKPEVPVSTVMSIAEPLASTLRTAEWHDRADAALADLEELDLRDLRSVVVASDAGAKDDETRALAEQLREGLNRRIESDHDQWVEDVKVSLAAGRTVRALRLSSRPVKAGAPLPPELGADLADAASKALAGDITHDRWATVIDAVAFSPVRGNVVPAGYPKEPSEELLEAVRRIADRLPEVAAHFGIDPAEAGKARRRRPKKKPAKKPAKPQADEAKADEAKADEAKADQQKPSEPSADEPSTEQTAEESSADAATTAPEAPDAAQEPAAEEPAPEASADAPTEAAADIPAEEPAVAEEAAPEAAADAPAEPVAEAPADEPVAAEEAAAEPSAEEPEAAPGPAEESPAEAEPSADAEPAAEAPAEEAAADDE